MADATEQAWSRLDNALKNGQNKRGLKAADESELRLLVMKSGS